jgi:hypothetical protein
MKPFAHLLQCTATSTLAAAAAANTHARRRATLTRMLVIKIRCSSQMLLLPDVNNNDCAKLQSWRASLPPKRSATNARAATFQQKIEKQMWLVRKIRTSFQFYCGTALAQLAMQRFASAKCTDFDVCCIRIQRLLAFFINSELAVKLKASVIKA